mmetsp:Transcript_13696/g.25703  ORF Transcript_13696/g.25703 Transcript_13696/m.25703 type:complete len:210 (-) Transcript_13696:340-969(-)
MIVLRLEHACLMETLVSSLVLHLSGVTLCSQLPADRPNGLARRLPAHVGVRPERRLHPILQSRFPLGPAGRNRRHLRRRPLRRRKYPNGLLHLRRLQRRRRERPLLGRPSDEFRPHRFGHRRLPVLRPVDTPVDQPLLRLLPRGRLSDHRRVLVAHVVRLGGMHLFDAHLRLLQHDGLFLQPGQRVGHWGDDHVLRGHVHRVRHQGSGG